MTFATKFNTAPGKRAGFPFFADEFFRPFYADCAPSGSAVAVNVLESAEAFHLEVAAPGLTKEDFKLSVEKDVLSIKVAKEKQAVEGAPEFRRREFDFSNFDRSFKLGKNMNLDAIEARYENGILLVKLPKLAEAQEKPSREIAIG
jgi:HSP20 family protein